MLLKVSGLKKTFPVKRGFFGGAKGTLSAVDGVDIDISRGETLGLVGESGCGKSTLGRSILRLIEPSAGSVDFADTDLLKLSAEKMRLFRRKMQLIFQDPYSSLNPRMTVGDIVSEPLLVHGLAKKSELQNKAVEILETVGLKASHISRYPHEFSGGQRQRVGIARAIALKPEFIVADEAVSALDVSIQSEIINLLMDLQEKLSLSYLFIAHDLKVVVQMSHFINVMYLGVIVEKLKGSALFQAKHPYTQALISAIPVVSIHERRKRIILKGDVPSPLAIPSGCRFHPRCAYAQDVCREKVPELRELGEQHSVACHFAEQIPDIGR